MRYRLMHNLVALSGFAIIVVGIGMDLVCSFAQSSVTVFQSKIIVYIGVFLIVGGLVLSCIGVLRKTQPVTSAYAGIIPILKNMDGHLRILAKKEAKRDIDMEKYLEVHKKINKEILKVVTSKAKTVKGVKKWASKLESSMKGNYKESVNSIKDAVNALEPNSTFLDASGFGLKQQRETNGKYLSLYRQLEHYRNLPIGTEVNELIKLHVRASEINANALLAIYRFIRLTKEAGINVDDLISTEMQISFEKFENTTIEETYSIRARIGECIRELEGKSSSERKSLILTPRSWAIGISGMSGTSKYPNKPEGAYWLRLEASVNSTYTEPIDTLDLLIGDISIPADSWPGRKVAAFTAYFDVTELKWKGEIQVELKARIEGDVHHSGRIKIDFNAEPGGFPRYL